MIKTTKICPNCKSERIEFHNIYKNDEYPNQYYCNDCHLWFRDIDVLIKKWVSLEWLRNEITDIRHACNEGKLQKTKVLINNLDSTLFLDCAEQQKDEARE